MVSLFPFGGFLTVTLANLMELRCRVEGEVGVEAMKIERDLLREDQRTRENRWGYEGGRPG